MKKGNVKEILIALVILLCVVTIIGAITIYGADTYITEDGSFEYTILEDGTIEITKYVGTETEVTIPGTIEEKTVTSIGESAFERCESITSVEIPESVISIEENAFFLCSSLTSIEFPKDLAQIGRGSFYECSSLTSIKIPQGVTSIGRDAFYKCTSLTSIEIPGRVISMEESVFSGCTSLININVNTNNQLYTSVDGVLFNKKMTDIICYPAGKKNVDYVIPSSVTSIASYAFYECSSLTSIEIPDSVTRIGDSAFCGCSSLISIGIPEGVTSIKDYAFRECESLTSIKIPQGVTNIGRYAFYKCTSLTSIEIPDRVTSIDEYAFYECSSLTSIEIPDSVTSIGDSAFRECKSLTSIGIPEGVKTIRDWTFAFCKSLTSIEIPEGVTCIEKYSFCGCSNLASIKIPEGVISIEDGAFRLCSNLTSIEIPDSVTSIGDSAFRGCKSLTSIKIPEGVTTIKGNTFSYCSSLTTVEIPEGVTSIKGNTFRECKSLTSIKIPQGVTSIGNAAFWGCYSLTSVEIPESVISIEKDAFCLCSDLTSIKIPQGVTSIGEDAFNGCYSLTIYCRSNSTAETYAKAKEISYVIDDEAPMVEHIIGNPEEWTEEDVTLIIEGAKDEVSGLAEAPYSFDGGETWQTENTKTYTENTREIIIQVKDILGNIYTHEEINITKIRRAESIEVTTMPKTKYIANENFECEGMVVKVTYDNGDVVETTDYTVLNGTNLKCGEQKIIIQYNKNQEIKTEVTVQVEHLVEIDPAVEPTCTQTGLTEGKYCSVCDKVLVAQEIIPALGHNYEEIVTNPTCTEKGYTTHRCKVCEDEYVDTYTNALNHIYENGECTRCGEDSPAITVETEIYNIIDRMITKISPKTILRNLKLKIQTNANKIETYNKNNEFVENDKAAGTGMKMKFFLNGKYEEYTLIVTGDTDGDGEAGFNDILQINKHRLNKVSLVNESLKAGDIDGNGKLEFNDILRINKYRLGKIDSL